MRKIENMSHLETEVNRIIALHKSLHGRCSIEPYSVSNDVLRLHSHLDKTSVQELTKHLIKEQQ